MLIYFVYETLVTANEAITQGVGRFAFVKVTLKLVSLGETKG